MSVIKAAIVTIIILMMSIAFSLISAENFSSSGEPYLGQNPPGTTPEYFGAGIIDNDERVFAITFSPDGKECFYTKTFDDNTIMTTKEENGKWLEPKIAFFSGKTFDFEPHITPDGTKLIFGSDRALPGTAEKGMHQWTLKKTDSGWSEPEPMGSPFDQGFCMYVSVANSGNIYFTGQGAIYESKYIDGKYFSPEKPDYNINALPAAAHPFIAPDESYLLFDAQPQDGNSELYISFKGDDNTWLKAVKLDSTFNTSANELCSFVSRDDKYMFFSRMSPGKGDIFWVDTKALEKYKEKE